MNYVLFNYSHKNIDLQRNSLFLFIFIRCHSEIQWFSMRIAIMSDLQGSVKLLHEKWCTSWIIKFGLCYICWIESAWIFKINIDHHILLTTRDDGTSFTSHDGERKTIQLPLPLSCHFFDIGSCGEKLIIIKMVL